VPARRTLDKRFHTDGQPLCKHLHEQGSRKIDYCCDAETMLGVPQHLYDLVVADPPYSVGDAEHYGLPMISRNKAIRELGERLSASAFVVWLDQVYPMYAGIRLQPEAVRVTSPGIQVLS
jgi:hypothetical protein